MSPKVTYYKFIKGSQRDKPYISERGRQMKKFNIKKATSETLRSKLFKCIKVQERTANFYDLKDAISAELNRRNRAAIYKMACQVLKNRTFPNQFAAAAHYADDVINSSDYFDTEDNHEIKGLHTKSGHPEIVYF